MLERLVGYADRNNLRLVTRPARVGELLPSQEVLVTGIKDGVIYAIKSVQVKMRGVG